MKTLNLVQASASVLTSLLLLSLSPWAQAQSPAPQAAAPNPSAVQAKDAWVRATVAQQKAAGLYVQLTSASGAQLVDASSPVAGVVQVHEMRMEGSVMKMRALPMLNLPAGQTVQLKPGGLHIMLMDLKKPLAVGETVPVTLTVALANGQREAVAFQARVLPLNSAGHAGHVDESQHQHPHGGHKH